MSIVSKILNIISHAFSTLFDYEMEKEKASKIFSFLFLIGLYFAGVFMWGKLTSWGSVPLNFHDWAEITVPRLQFIKDTLHAGVLPLHMLDTIALHDVTDRFFSLPDVITTPQMALLFFVNVPQFVLIDILFHYTLGAITLFFFRQKYKLSLFSFTILFILFNFNGYILSHYTVGHFTWASYFLFPAFFMLLFNFLDGEQGWRWVTKMSLLLFYMILTGGEHHYVWLLILLGVLMIVCWKRAKWIFASALFSGLLSAIRLIPPALVLDIYQKKQVFNFVVGYPSIGHIIEALGLTRAPLDIPSANIKYFDLDVFQANYWEFNLYIGAIGTILVLWGLFQWVKSQNPLYKELTIPSFILILLSLNSVYWLPKLSQIPLFGGERIASRMMGVPLVLFLLIVTILLEEQLKKYKLTRLQKSIGLSLLAFTWIDIWNNLKTWRLSSMSTFFGTHVVDLTAPTIGNHPDPVYTNTLAIALLISIVTLIFLLLMSWKEKAKPTLTTT